MSKKQTSQDVINSLSVIIPTYNGEKWLEKTITRVKKAIDYAGLKTFEIIIIDDGSTDKTKNMAELLMSDKSLKISVYSQKNSGRFMARRNGANVAQYPYLLYVDTRVFIGEQSLKYILQQNSLDQTRKVWCSHVRVDTRNNVYAQFWSALTYIAWRDYFKNPRNISYREKEFDKFPKGTTCFFIKKSILVEANRWFVKNTKDTKNSNDDTLLIRYIARTNSINISPDFWCTYHARSGFAPYVRHVFHRGKVFVDGFLRNDGNIYFLPLILFLGGSFMLSLSLLVWPSILYLLIPSAATIWILGYIVIYALGVPRRDGLSLWLLSPVFGVVYGLGIWRAFIGIYVLGIFSKK
jgi:glycosyltransferase involved in cell wall biosynthesis